MGRGRIMLQGMDTAMNKRTQKNTAVRMTQAVFMLVAISILPGCAALKSTRHNDDRLAPGLGYYLPNGDLKVTMTVSNDGGGPTRVFKVETLYYPDVTERYSVTVPKNILGATEADIQVSEAGLLESVTYTYEPKILEAIAGIPPTAPAQALTARDADGPCGAPGDYVAIVAPADGEGTLCGFRIKVASLGTTARTTAAIAQPDASYGRYAATGQRMPSNGLYFRMNLPYRVDIYDKDNSGQDALLVYSDIALSPTGASTLFVQTHRSLFATISGSIAFENGVLVSFAPKSSSEIETAFKLPAAILRAYFNSVNALFVLRKGAADSETQYLGALENMRKAQADLQACQAAYATGDKASIDSACGTQP